MVCNKCGKELEEGSSFCRYCGAPTVTDSMSNSINEAAIQSNSQENKAKQKRKKWPIIIVAIVVVMGMLASMFFLMPRGLEKDAKKCVAELENRYGNIQVIDAIAISFKSVNEMKIKLFIAFECNGKSTVAGFWPEDDGSYIYEGDGYNGGTALTDIEEQFANLHTLASMKTYLEYKIGETKVITFEDAKAGKEGVIPLNINKLN